MIGGDEPKYLEISKTNCLMLTLYQAIHKLNVHPQSIKPHSSKSIKPLPIKPKSKKAHSSITSLNNCI